MKEKDLEKKVDRIECELEALKEEEKERRKTYIKKHDFIFKDLLETKKALEYEKEYGNLTREDLIEKLREAEAKAEGKKLLDICEKLIKPFEKSPYPWPTIEPYEIDRITRWPDETIYGDRPNITTTFMFSKGDTND
jgi:hypothetical protein